MAAKKKDYGVPEWLLEMDPGLTGGDYTLARDMYNYDKRLANGGGSIMYGTPPDEGAGQTSGNKFFSGLVDGVKDATGGMVDAVNRVKAGAPKFPATAPEEPKDPNDSGNGKKKSQAPASAPSAQTPVSAPVTKPAPENAAPQYQGTYQDQIDQMLQEIMNGGEFKYDFAVDPIYQQYAERYNRNGKLAMMDTMAKAATMTGGYGSTYGQQVGQQAYNGYMQDLNAVIPDLYEMAFDRFLAENDRKRNNLALLQGMDDTEYNRFMDQLAFDYQKQQDALAQENYLREFYIKNPNPASAGGGGAGSGQGGSNKNQNVDDSRNDDETMERDLAEAAAAFYRQHPDVAIDSRTVSNFVGEYVKRNNYPASASELMRQYLMAQGMTRHER